MPRAETLLLFAVAAAVLIAIPGPSAIYVVTRALSEGRRSGVASALGVETGDAIHVAAAAVGLSALVASSAHALSIVKYVGAAYLVYLGIRTLRSRVDVDPNTSGESGSVGRIYAQGLLIHVLNPKVLIFFLAVVPQFIDKDRGPVASQVLVLGGVFVMVGLVFDLVYVLGASAIRSWLIARPLVLRRQRHVAGLVYIALGAVAAFSGANRRS
jgi:threonine/homoserine/homoserine lactone efflux protein